MALLTIAAPSAAGAEPRTPPDRPPRVQQLGDWRRQHPEGPRGDREPWTPAVVAELMRRHPEAVLNLGILDGTPPGNRDWLDVGARVRELRAIAASEGIELGNRLCVSFRFDVQTPNPAGLPRCDPFQGGGGCDWEGRMDGRHGEREVVVKRAGAATGGDERSLRDASARWLPGQWSHRLLVLRPGRPDEEEGRIAGSSRDRLQIEERWKQAPRRGDAYEIRGSFDPAWIQRVPRELHEATLAKLWVGKRDICGPEGCPKPAEPLDPLDPDNRRAWPRSVDRAAIEALATSSQVPALYGFVRGQSADGTTFDDPHFSVAALVMRVDDPAYQDWASRVLLYQLEDQGIPPGQPACILFAYKPGWHVWYDEERHGRRSDPCFVPGAHAWEGPAHPCRARRMGGLLAPTRFGPGVFEQAVNDFILRLFRVLGGAGYSDVKMVTVERPRFHDRIWSILSEEVRSHPGVAGELSGSLNPPLSSLRTPAAAPPAREEQAPRRPVRE